MHPWKYLFSSDRSQRLRTSEFADAEKWQELSMFAHWVCKVRALQRVDYWSLLKIRYSSSYYCSPVKYSLQNFSQFLARPPCCFRVFLSAGGYIPVSTSISVSSLNCYNPGVFQILKNQHYQSLISQLQEKKQGSGSAQPRASLTSEKTYRNFLLRNSDCQDTATKCYKGQ